MMDDFLLDENQNKFHFTDIVALADELLSREFLSSLEDKHQKERAKKRFIESFKPNVKRGNVRIAAVGTEKSGKTTLLSSILGRDIRREFLSIELEDERFISKTWISGIEIACITGANETYSITALDFLRKSDLIIQVSDFAVKRPDIVLHRSLRTLEKPILVALNKCDLYKKKNWDEMINYAETTMGMRGIPFSAKTGENLSLVIAKICELLPEDEQVFMVSKLTNLGNHIKSQRIRRQKLVAKEKACDQIIRDAAVKAADTVGQRLIPGSDIGALLAIEVKMIYDISNIYNDDGIDIFSKSSVKKNANAFIKMSSQVLVKFLPTVGVILSQALVLNWITLSGKAAVKHFQNKMSLEEASNVISESLFE